MTPDQRRAVILIYSAGFSAIATGLLIGWVFGAFN